MAYQLLTRPLLAQALLLIGTWGLCGCKERDNAITDGFVVKDIVECDYAGLHEPSGQWLYIEVLPDGTLSALKDANLNEVNIKNVGDFSPVLVAPRDIDATSFLQARDKTYQAFGRHPSMLIRNPAMNSLYYFPLPTGMVNAPTETISLHTNGDAHSKRLNQVLMQHGKTTNMPSWFSEMNTNSEKTVIQVVVSPHIKLQELVGLLMNLGIQNPGTGPNRIFFVIAEDEMPEG